MNVPEMSTATQRHFLDWHQLPLPAAAKWLAGRHSRGSKLEMSPSIIVVPGSRSQRRLLELLVDIAEQESLVFTPPELTTVGSLPEFLYTPARPLASSLVQTLAWVEALRNTDSARLRQITSQIPHRDDSLSWKTLAKVIAAWHNDLAGNGLTFRDVLRAGEAIESFQEQERWQALFDIQRIYLDMLNANETWDRQTARLVAVDRKECSIDRDIYLIGTVDLNPIVRAMLGQVPERVHSLIFCKPNESHTFDELGCLNMEHWQQPHIPVTDDAICVADQPSDQARVTCRFLAELDGEYGIDEIAISVPDPRLVSHLSRTLAESSIKTNDIGGSSIGNSRPFVLVELLSTWLDDKRFESFAALVRHPDIYQWLVQRVNNAQWLKELDEYQNNRLPFHISTEINNVYFGGKDYHGKDRYAQLSRAYKEVYELIQPLLSRTGKPLAAWASPWRQVLVAIYRDTVLDRTNSEHRRTIRACQQVVKSLLEIEESGSLLKGEVDSVEAAHWALDLCGGQFVSDPTLPDAITLLGWLDTPWEDTPVTVLTNFNESYVPSSENSNLFLPNSIRSQLGMVDNRRRFARDAYATSLVWHSRKKVLFVVGRRDEEGLPLLPSRLLMTGKPEETARRALALFQEGEVTSGWSTAAQANRPSTQQFVVPLPPEDAEPINSLRVTDFKVYMQCPYHFYLTRVLGLKRLADKQDELDGGQFGSLLHDVVENFGRSEKKNSRSSDEIEAYVIDCLNRFSMARYGRRPMPTVQIQLEQARIRLRAFSQWQAEHRAAGFEIFEVEREKTQYEFTVDGEPFLVKGQIDRIDINHDKRIIGVYDYKTGDKGEKPRELHQDNHGEWKDLQLPLYHHLLSNFDELPKDYEIQAGLILMAKDTSQVALFLADWDSNELSQADFKAFEIMRNVRKGEFWPMSSSKPPPFWDDFAPICQSKIFEKWQPAPSQSSKGAHPF